MAAGTTVQAVASSAIASLWDLVALSLIMQKLAVGSRSYSNRGSSGVSFTDVM
ncbi:hypothetical protein [Dolichospermum compactum]|uniref:hypothetical protein n=1 Tax=Dolichospermum compactum TaxID=136073 RepID=UPI0012FDB91C|nr:hypothetical protein [Dolichospermum compactum]